MADWREEQVLRNQLQQRAIRYWVIRGGGLFALVLAAAMWGCPQYAVYSRRLDGESLLRQAEFTRRIAIEEARARLESADLDAQSERIRAQGVADANEIIAEGLGGPEGYLRYLWIQGLQNDQSDVIYIPTEAGLPILEASRLTPDVLGAVQQAVQNLAEPQ